MEYAIRNTQYLLRSTMTPHFQTLLEKVYEIHDLDKAAGVLAWDRQVNMPDGGATARTQQMATLRRISHNLSVSDEFGEAIEAAESELSDAAYDSNEAALLRHLRYAYEQERKLPAE